MSCCFFMNFVQYEGAAFKYGKGASIWDTYTHQHSGSFLLSLEKILEKLSCIAFGKL